MSTLHPAGWNAHPTHKIVKYTHDTYAECAFCGIPVAWAAAKLPCPSAPPNWRGQPAMTMSEVSATEAAQ